MSVSWIMALMLPVAGAAGWLSARFSQEIRSSLAILSACRGLDAGDVRHDSPDIRPGLEGDDGMPGVRSRRDWPFLIDLANRVASLIRCGQDCPFSVKVSDPD